MKSKGYSLHIGVDKVDQKHYGGLTPLTAAVKDAVDWDAFASSLGYSTVLVADRNATSTFVRKQLEEYGNKAMPGDIVMITYSGHGGELPNDKPDQYDDEVMDQTWCLYDRQFIDDEIYDCLTLFKKGVRVTVVSDSCHSGTVTRVEGLDLSKAMSEGMADMAKSAGMRSKKLPREVALLTRAKNKAEYDKVQGPFRNKSQASAVVASIKLLAACQDDEETLDGDNNGLFTGALLELLKDAQFSEASGERLVDAVRSKYYFPLPNFFQFGGIINSYDLGSPFKVEIPDAAEVTGHRDPDLTTSRRPRKKYDGSMDPWNTLESKIPAELLIEITGVVDAFKGGNDIEVLQSKRKGDLQQITVRVNGVPAEQAWTAAHALQTALIKIYPKGVTVEPILSVMPAQKAFVSREADADNPDYIKEWPPSLMQGKPEAYIGWHLDEQHSQLTKAFGKIKEGTMHVKIAHFDTGYIEHPALPKNLQRQKGKNFVDGEDENSPIDKENSGQDGHGLGTVTILAGNLVNKEQTFGEYDGKYIGGVPFAEVIPIRISDSVVILNSRSFCDAIDYAIEQQVDVVSMSMAGKPSRKMAQAVNRAYEAGIVLVTAASNCWYKGAGALLPKCVMFPAAFERVIAATGAMYNHQPYDVDYLQRAKFNITTKYMQGAWGPASRMTRALAAYTPNIPWATPKLPFVRSGGGTSSATPQVAAAAATWLAYHRSELDARGYNQAGQRWKRVEAVRWALYESSAKGEVFPYWEKYYGRGIVRAFDAIEKGVPADNLLQKSPEAESSLFGILDALGSFFKNRRWFRAMRATEEPGSVQPQLMQESLSWELLSLLQTDASFFDDFSSVDLGNEKSVEILINNPVFRNKILKSPYASHYLKSAVAE